MSLLIWLNAHQRKRGRLPRQRISYHIVLPLDILNVKIVGLDLTHPLLLPLLQLLLLQKESEAIVVCPHPDPVPH